MWKIFQQRNSQKKMCKNKARLDARQRPDGAQRRVSIEPCDDERSGGYCIIHYSFLSMIPDYLLFKMEPTFH